MKAITLHTAAASNGGARIAAGTTVAVGGKPDQIEVDRAKALVADGSAVEVVASAKPPAPAAPAAEPAAD